MISSPKPMLHISMRLQRHMLQACVLLLILLPLGAAGFWWYGKHQFWKNNLQRAQSLYSRLEGMQQQKDAIAQALQQTQQAQTVFFYPADMPAEQAANAALQGVRQVLDKAGMKVESSQVKIAENADPSGADAAQANDYTQRIELLVSAEGGWVSLQLALAALREVRPVLSLDRMYLGTRMRLQSADPGREQAINVSFVFSLRKLKEGA